MKKIIIYLILSLILNFNMANVKAAEEDTINITKNATAAILVDYNTGDVLYNKNANSRKEVASLTKMMGLILIFENMEKGGINKDEIITVSKNAKNMGGTQIWLEEGEKISVDDLIKGITMASANDAMVAMAERISGSEEAFVNEMNKKAKELGLASTHFINSTGLDSEGAYSSAYDLAIISRELLKHQDILSYTSVYEDYIRNNTENKTWISNTNKLVRFYEGADGLKTGFTDNAGSCMAVTAKKNGLRLIAITLGYTESKIRNQETMDLLDYGFNQYKARVLFKKGDIVATKAFDKATSLIKYITNEDITILQKKTDEEKDYNMNIINSDFKLPVKAGEKIGMLYIKDNDDIKLKVPLSTLEDVSKISFIKLYFINILNTLI